MGIDRGVYAQAVSVDRGEPALRPLETLKLPLDAVNLGNSRGVAGLDDLDARHGLAEVRVRGGLLQGQERLPRVGLTHEACSGHLIALDDDRVLTGGRVG